MQSEKRAQEKVVKIEAVQWVETSRKSISQMANWIFPRDAQRAMNP